MSQSPNPKAALVVEDEPHTRAWLADVLRQAFGRIPVAAVGNVAAARAWLQAAGQGPAVASDDGSPALVVLVDLGLPDGSGLEVIGLLARDHPTALPVVTTIYDDDAHLLDAMAAGAGGYLLKDSDATTMATYLRRILDGEPPLSPPMARRILTHFRKASPAPTPAPVPEPNATAAILTPREREVLGLLGRGLRTAEVAQVLGLSEHTVASYIKTIYGKLSISSRAEAALEAHSRGLV
ncbi:MAG: hypothetical protein VR70_00065 [Rhodospirillaceae bacterium BRH_c57]|nr:MAG: hypothetical protein VR70_00065 [Rhodospirillaceae bacterium BRH_c57]